MKKLAILLALTLLAGSAFAITDDGPNSLGVYFDAGTFAQNCTQPPMYVPYHMYFVLANCDFATIAGFEFGWRFNPNPVPAPIISAATLPPNALNLGTNYNFLVGLGTPLTTGEAAVLVDLTLVNLGPVASTFIQAGPAVPSSILLHACFNNGADVGQLLPMSFSTVDGVTVVVDDLGWVNPGLGGFNLAGGCPGQNPVATESATWGGVKALFE